MAENVAPAIAISFLLIVFLQTGDLIRWLFILPTNIDVRRLSAKTITPHANPWIRRLAFIPVRHEPANLF